MSVQSIKCYKGKVSVIKIGQTDWLQPQETNTPVLVLSMLMCAPSPASSTTSTGLQLGTDAGMSSVLLTMVGSQWCNKERKAPQQRCSEMLRIACKKLGEKILLLWLTRASWLHAKGTSLQKQGKSTEEGQWCTWWGSHTWFTPPSPWPLCLCVASPRPLRVALRKAKHDKLFVWRPVVQFSAARCGNYSISDWKLSGVVCLLWHSLWNSSDCFLLIMT